MRVPAGGGSAESLLEKPFVIGRYSPDGRQIGILISDYADAPERESKVAVMDSEARNIKKAFEWSDISSEGRTGYFVGHLMAKDSRFREPQEGRSIYGFNPLQAELRVR